MKLIKGESDLAIMGARPLFDELRHVGRPNVGNRQLFNEYVEEIFANNWLTNDGPFVQRLEKELADYLGVEHCIATVNGTVALELAVRALGMSGQVVVPSYTFVATAHALKWQGIEPVFADIDEKTHNVDPLAIEQLITEHTRGILAVHLWGRPADVERIGEVAEAHGLPLVYDAAHAFGVTNGGTFVGNFGDAEIFSFHATKFFNSFEGGAITTNNPDVAQRLRLSRNFGFAGLDDVVAMGTNGKMTEVCAAMGLANLESISQVVERNRAVYQAYQESLTGLSEVSVLRFDESEHGNFQYVVLEAGSGALRDHLVRVLRAENVYARKYFWPGCHGMTAYKTEGFLGGDLSRTEEVAKRVVVLPSGSSVTPAEATAISEVIRCSIDTCSTWGQARPSVEQ